MVEGSGTLVIMNHNEGTTVASFPSVSAPPAIFVLSVSCFELMMYHYHHDARVTHRGRQKHTQIRPSSVLGHPPARYLTMQEVCYYWLRLPLRGGSESLLLIRCQMMQTPVSYRKHF